MYIKKALGIGLLIAAPQLSMAEAEITSIEASGNGYEYSFPIVKNVPASHAINAYLQLKELRLSSTYKASPFENVWPKEGEPTFISRLDYSIDYNSSHLLGLNIDSVFTGAWSVQGTRRYYLDAQSGQQVYLNDIFTTKGLKELEALSRVDQRRQVAAISETLDAMIAAIPIEPQHEHKRADALTLIKDQYTACLSRRIPTAPLQVDNFQLDNDGLIIPFGRCSYGPGAALDNSEPIYTKLQIANLTPYMSTYGHCLLLEESKNCAPSKKFATGVLYGILKSKEVTLLVSSQSEYSQTLLISDDAVIAEFSVRNSLPDNETELFIGNTFTPSGKVKLTLTPTNNHNYLGTLEKDGNEYKISFHP
ncbi:Protein of uncharacterised function (DUF3298) [Stutzerimonas stutzeri]|nr:Protein of uncharacterised function (DUF3298) [Stutzerimonas stutzeri]